MITLSLGIAAACLSHVAALLILGSIATSDRRAGTDIRGLVDGETGHTVISEEQSQPSRPPIGGAYFRYRYFRRGAAIGCVDGVCFTWKR
jgi:hypothetical protein